MKLLKKYWWIVLLLSGAAYLYWRLWKSGMIRPASSYANPANGIKIPGVSSALISASAPANPVADPYYNSFGGIA